MDDSNRHDHSDADHHFWIVKLAGYRLALRHSTPLLSPLLIHYLWRRVQVGKALQPAVTAGVSPSQPRGFGRGLLPAWRFRNGSPQRLRHVNGYDEFPPPVGIPAVVFPPMPPMPMEHRQRMYCLPPCWRR
jgi:hypothetical protein